MKKRGRSLCVPVSVGCVMIWLTDDVWIEARGNASALDPGDVPTFVPLAGWHVYEMADDGTHRRVSRYLMTYRKAMKEARAIVRMTIHARSTSTPYSARAARKRSHSGP